MSLTIQILIVLGASLVIYAVVMLCAPGKPKVMQLQKIKNLPRSLEDTSKDQKIQRLQSQVAKLESQISQSKTASPEIKTELMTAKEKEAEFSLELKRREEWVAKAETELAKARTENIDLNKKITVKENELQEEFTKNVNLARQLQEVRGTLEVNQTASRLKDDQLEAQKHQGESQLKNINALVAEIAEFKRKEKISEWVPKQEFNQLNEAYTKLEKDLEANQERLKNFAVEITHLRQTLDKKVQIAKETEPMKESIEEIKLIEGIKPTESNAREENIEKKSEQIKEG